MPVSGEVNYSSAVLIFILKNICLPPSSFFWITNFQSLLEGHIFQPSSDPSASSPLLPLIHHQTWRKRVAFLSYIFHITLAHIYSCMTFANGIKQLMATQSKTHCSLISSPAERRPYQSFPIRQFIHGTLHSFYQIQHISDCSRLVWIFILPSKYLQTH